MSVSAPAADFHVRDNGFVYTLVSPTGDELYSLTDERQAEAEARLLNEARSSELADR